MWNGNKKKYSPSLSVPFVAAADTVGVQWWQSLSDSPNAIILFDQIFSSQGLLSERILSFSSVVGKKTEKPLIRTALWVISGESNQILCLSKSTHTTMCENIQEVQVKVLYSKKVAKY